MGNKFEEILSVAKLNDLIHKKEQEDKKKDTVLWILAAIGIITAVVGIAYAVHRFLMRDYLDFDDELDDYDDEFYDDDLCFNCNESDSTAETE